MSNPRVLIGFGIFFLMIFAGPSCGTKPDKDREQGLSFKVPLPSPLVDGAGLAGLKAELVLDGNEKSPLLLTVNPGDNTCSGTMPGILAGGHQLTLRYYVLYGISQIKLALAEQTQAVNVVKDQITTVNFSHWEYTYPNHDSDGVSNLDEVYNNFDPLNRDAIGRYSEIDLNPAKVPSLDNVYMLSPDQVFAVSGSGILLYYNGEKWSSLDIMPPDGFNAVQFINSNEGWVAGSTGSSSQWLGLLLHYLNGTWTRVAPPVVSNYWGIHSISFTSSSQGWAAGYDCGTGQCYDGDEKGVLLQYSGGSWSKVDPPDVDSNSWELFSIHFPIPGEGWAAGSDWDNNQGLILHYSGGVWSKVDPPAISSSWVLVSLHFPVASEGWAVGVDREHIQGLLLHYSGGTWSKVDPPAISPAWGLNSVHFTSAAEGWAVGIDCVDTTSCNNGNEKVVLLHYTGGTWAQVTPPVTGPYDLWSVHFVNPSEGWVVGTDISDLMNRKGVAFHYSQGTWTKVELPPVKSNGKLYGLQFSGAAEGWAVGGDWSNSKAALFHYTGGTWANVAPPAVNTNWHVRSVSFTSASEGWAVGGQASGNTIQGALLHYTAGAWTFVPPPALNTNWYLHAVSFPTAAEGWAAGIDCVNSDCGDGDERGLLLQYSTGTWKSVSPPAVSGNWRLFSLHFPSVAEGWAVGIDDTIPQGVLLHYSGGGWTKETPPAVSARWHLNSVHFISPTEGWAVGADWESLQGVLLHYSGGLWLNVSPPPVSSHWDLYFIRLISPTEAWAGGADLSDGYKGILLHYLGGTWSKFDNIFVDRSNWELKDAGCPDPNTCYFIGEGDGQALVLKY